MFSGSMKYYQPDFFGLIWLTGYWTMKNFKALRIWRNGMEIASLAYALTGSFPEQEKFSLGYQIKNQLSPFHQISQKAVAGYLKKNIAVFLKLRWVRDLNWKHRF
jgi:hypothetical protein